MSMAGYREDKGNFRCQFKRRRLDTERLSDGFKPVDFYQTFQRREEVRYTALRDGAAPRTRVLLFRDSFSNELIPYLANSFDELIVVPRVRLKHLPGVIRRHNPDLVIYEFVERSLIRAPELSAAWAGYIKEARQKDG